MPQCGFIFWGFPCKLDVKLTQLLEVFQNFIKSKKIFIKSIKSFKVKLTLAMSVIVLALSISFLWSILTFLSLKMEISQIDVTD